MSERILRWFGDKRIEAVLGMVEEHLELTQNSVRELYKMISAAATGDGHKEILYKELSSFEMKANQLRKDMIIELTKRKIYPSERADLIELVRAVDWVADWAREAGRILVIIPFERSPEKIKIASQNMCKACDQCVSILVNCVKTLSKEPSKALELADAVEKMEENIDELYSISRKYLATLTFKGFNTGSLILLNMFLDALETIADWCEKSVDIVRSIAIRIQ